MTSHQSNPKPDHSSPVVILGDALSISDPTTLAFALEQQLADLHQAHLDGEDVEPWLFVELEDALEAALAAEPADVEL